jgi:hypothetical protein
MIVRLKKGMRSEDGALLSEGRDYTVYAIHSACPVRFLVSDEDAFSFPFFVAADAFDVVDGSVSSNWALRSSGECNAEIEFPEMARNEMFYQRLVDGVPDETVTWNRIKRLMDREAQELATVRALGANPKRLTSADGQKNTVYVVLRISGRTEEIQQVAVRLSALDGRVEGIAAADSRQTASASWYFHVTERDAASTAPVIRTMLDTLRPFFGDLIDISQDACFETSLDCTVIFEEGQARLEICSDSMRDLAACSLAVAFDVNAIP